MGDNVGDILCQVQTSVFLINEQYLFTESDAAPVFHGTVSKIWYSDEVTLWQRVRNCEVLIIEFQRPHRTIQRKGGVGHIIWCGVYPDEDIVFGGRLDKTEFADNKTEQVCRHLRGRLKCRYLLLVFGGLLLDRRIGNNCFTDWSYQG